jgi:hypothetical protein
MNGQNILTHILEILLNTIFAENNSVVNDQEVQIYGFCKDVSLAVHSPRLD